MAASGTQGLIHPVSSQQRAGGLISVLSFSGASIVHRRISPLIFSRLPAMMSVFAVPVTWMWMLVGVVSIIRDKMRLSHECRQEHQLPAPLLHSQSRQGEECREEWMATTFRRCM
mmetsp:Transcript_20959/g.59803  ORF Transcript_20959/g.59803 Transcript_20959/m.59803 type:complete len:115 (+) Transcript_20959:769-1113(+)